LERRLGGSQRQSGRYEEEKNLDPAGIRTVAVQPVAIPTQYFFLFLFIFFNI
jgi:hypothetical protein